MNISFDELARSIERIWAGLGTSEPIYLRWRSLLCARIGRANGAVIPPSFETYPTLVLKSGRRSEIRGALLERRPIVLTWHGAPMLVLMPVE